MAEMAEDALRYQRVHQTRWQRGHRERKAGLRECQENGCHNETDGYRCGPCRRVHALRERERQRRLGMGR
jgi:hypothetical protein